jgi:hypothetical protein
VTSGDHDVARLPHVAPGQHRRPVLVASRGQTSWRAAADHSQRAAADGRPYPLAPMRFKYPHCASIATQVQAGSSTRLVRASELVYAATPRRVRTTRIARSSLGLGSTNARNRAGHDPRRRPDSRAIAESGQDRFPATPPRGGARYYLEPEPCGRVLRNDQ